MPSEPALIDVAPFREAFLRLGPASSEFIRLFGCRDRADVRKSLGIDPYCPGHGRPMRVRAKIRRERAARLCELLGLDPFEVGL